MANFIKTSCLVILRGDPILKILTKGVLRMTKEQKLAILKDRYKKLYGSPKNLKSGGVVRKLARQIRNMEEK